MGRRIGICFIILGVCCILASIGFIVHNHVEEDQAGEASQVILQEMKEKHQAKVDGYDCIGILSVPVLELELPILNDWSYESLKVAPCRYYGSCEEKDFVLAGHNYQSHFGRLEELQEKDLVLFTDLSGTVYCYEVVLLETLPPSGTKEMITSGFDLSLYTCTFDGSRRVTVRCKLIKKEEQ